MRAVWSQSIHEACDAWSSGRVGKSVKGLGWLMVVRYLDLGYSVEVRRLVLVVSVVVRLERRDVLWYLEEG